MATNLSVRLKLSQIHKKKNYLRLWNFTISTIFDQKFFFQNLNSNNIFQSLEETCRDKPLIGTIFLDIIFFSESSEMTQSNIRIIVMPSIPLFLFSWQFLTKSDGLMFFFKQYSSTRRLKCRTCSFFGNWKAYTGCWYRLDSVAFNVSYLIGTNFRAY